MKELFEDLGGSMVIMLLGLFFIGICMVVYMIACGDGGNYQEFLKTIFELNFFNF